MTGIDLKAINSSKKVLKITGPALFRINSVIISARTVFVVDLLTSRNRKRCQQTGSRQSTPQSTIRARYGNSASTQEPHGLAKPAEFSPKGTPRRNFSIDPTSSIRTPIADATFADAISETPIMGLFRWSVFHHGGGARKQPIKRPTEMPTSTMALMGRFPSLMARFPTLMGRFPDFILRGRFTC